MLEPGVASAQVDQRGELRLGGQIARRHRRAGWVGRVGPQLLDDVAQHREIHSVVLGRGLLSLAEVGSGGGVFACFEMVECGGQGQPGIGCGGRGADACHRPPQRCVVAGEDEAEGEAVQKLGEQRSVGAVCGVFESGYGLVVGGPPAGGGGVQLGHPSQAVAVQVGDQVGAQQLLDPVRVTSWPGRRDQ